MSKITGGIMDTLAADNLVASDYPGLVARALTLTTSAEIQRGTVLTRESDGTYAVLGAGSGTAAAIVAVPTEEDDTVVEAYVSGCFYRNLLLPENTLTETDEFNLRLAGSLLTDGI